jgi:hypothetical protein
LFNSENLSVVPGEKLIAVAGDKQAGLKAKDRLTVTAVSDKGIEATIEGKKIIVPTDRPLYVSHAYVASPGNRDNEAGTVLAALNARDITGQTMNSLAQSGAKAEIFTSEAQDKAEARLQRMRTDSSPFSLFRSSAANRTPATPWRSCGRMSKAKQLSPFIVPSRTSRPCSLGKSNWLRQPGAFIRI